MSTPEKDARITPIDELFTYHIFGAPGNLRGWQEDIGSYSLGITGLVERPMALSVSRIQEDFEPVSRDMVLQCMTNVHWGRIRFTGARLLDVLEQAGPSEGACKVALHGADGFDTDLRIEEIRERPDAFLLAYEMNDEPVPSDHGFPIRLTSEGRYGFKWPKWLVEVEVVDYDYKGHYEGRRGWSDAAVRGRPVT